MFLFFIGVCIGTGVIIFGVKIKYGFGYSFILCTIGAPLSFVSAYLTKALEHQNMQEQEPVVNDSVSQHVELTNNMSFGPPQYPAQPISWNQQLSFQGLHQVQDNESRGQIVLAPPQYESQPVSSYQDSSVPEIPKNASDQRPQLYIDQSQYNFSFEQDSPVKN